MVMLFSFDTVDSFRRLVDFKGGASDLGAYVNYGRLQFYNMASGPSPQIQASNYTQVVLTRDASSNVVGYVDGVQQFSFVDSANMATLSASPLSIRFFKDDGSEDASGAVARIRLFDKVMPPAQVATLDRLSLTGGPLQFITPCYYSNQVMYLTLKVTPNVSYLIQTSTNLLDWVSLTNVTSPVSTVIITDPDASKYQHRYYRGLTQGTVSTLSPPVAPTGAATSVGVRSATFGASINPGGALARYFFQYGITSAYGINTLTNTLPAGNSSAFASLPATGLLPATLYHYRVVATNSLGTALGSDATFTTLNTPVVSGAAWTTGHQLSLSLSGSAGASYTLETSTNLADWTPRSSCLMDGSGLCQFVETNASSRPKLFYRLRWP
jgi:hypothetical protein